MLQANQARVADQLLVADDQVCRLYGLGEIAQVVSLARLFFSGAVVKTDVLPVHEAVEPGELNLFLFVSAIVFLVILDRHRRRTGLDLALSSSAARCRFIPKPTRRLLEDVLKRLAGRLQAHLPWHFALKVAG